MQQAKYLRSLSNTIQMQKALSRASVLVCPFWAIVETWRCNMADYVEDGPLLMQIRRAHSTLMKKTMIHSSGKAKT